MLNFLDAASSEPLHPAAEEAWRAASARAYADPRRLHRPAREARLVLDNARAVVAECVGARPDEVSFTGSGTQAVHLGLLGLAMPLPEPVLWHSAVEHSSVLHAAEWLREQHPGTTDIRVGRVDELGRAQVPASIETGRDVDVIALQVANHEVGTLQPLTQLRSAHPKAALFVDACAGLGRIEIPAVWDVLAGSAHKFGGPAGVGILVIRKGTRWRNPFPADDRIDHRATGFENVPGALATAAALQASLAERPETAARQHDLIERIRQVASTIEDCAVVGDPEQRLPHLVTFSCLYVDGEALVTELDRLGHCVASGSACTASSLTPSHVLAAMGALTHGNVRVSLTRDTTAEQVEALCRDLPEVVARLRQEIGAPP